MENLGADRGASTRITSGLTLDTLVTETLAFVRKQLPHWRDDPDRSHAVSENNLNMQLCKYLNVRARHEFPMAHFNREEQQAPRRTVDLSVTPDSVIVVGTRRFTRYDPYLVIEGKRLPAPTSTREKEYVTGFRELSGGLQRFKLGLHGLSLDIAAMVGYVQDDDPDAWLVRINEWIASLRGTDCSERCRWYSSEQIGEYRLNKRARVASSRSKHPRSSAGGTDIIIHHFWVSMRKTRARPKKYESDRPAQ